MGTSREALLWFPHLALLTLSFNLHPFFSTSFPHFAAFPSVPLALELYGLIRVIQHPTCRVGFSQQALASGHMIANSWRAAGETQPGINEGEMLLCDPLSGRSLAQQQYSICCFFPAEKKGLVFQL